MADFSPLVSIIIPVYNGSNYVREAIDSALAQTYKNIEIVVVNDGSKDNGATEQICLSYGDKIRYFAKENGGVATALNLAIRESKGEYISWLSHDDMYKPEKIEKQVEFLKNSVQDVVVFCDFDIIDANGSFVRKAQVYNKRIKNVKLQLAIGHFNAFNGCTLLIPRIFFEKYGYFDPELRYTQDYDMWFRIALYEKFVYCPQSLVLSRQHEKQDSKLHTDLCTIEADRLHYRLLSSITSAELNENIDKPIELLEEILNVYYNANYIKTTCIVIKHIFDISVLINERNKSAAVLNDFIFKLNKDLSDNFLSELEKIQMNNSKKKILIYSNVWNLGGIERVLSILMGSFTLTYTVILVSCGDNSKKEYPIPDNVIHIRLSNSDMDKITFRLSGLSLLLGVKLFIGNPNFLADFIRIYKILNELGIKSIAWNHYNYFLPYHLPVLYNLLPNRVDCLKHATVSIWLTSFSALAYLSQNENGVLMPNPYSFEATDFKARFGKTIIAVGRFQDNLKRLDLILETFKNLLKKDSSARLLLVGFYDKMTTFPPDYNKTAEEIFKHCNFPENSIIFAGEQENVSEFYKKASILIHACESEGFSMVLNEAGSFGIPCAVFDYPGVEDIIVDGENGFVVPFGDTDKMAEKLNLLISDRHLYEKMSVKAQQMISRFDKKIITQRWLYLLDIVLSDLPDDEIKNNIAENFMPKNFDTTTFVRRLVREYELGAKLIAERSNFKRSNMPVSPKIPVKSPHFIFLPFILLRDLFVSLRDDDLRTTWKKIMNKLQSFTVKRRN